MKHKKYSRGFTLIEVLIGILIFSIIALSLYSSFAAGMNLSRKIDKPLRMQRDAFWALEQIAADLENMVFYDFSNSYPDQKGFASDHESLEFFLPTGKGLKAVRYTLKSADEGTVTKTLIGTTTKENVAVVNKTETAQKLVSLIREEQDIGQFLQSGFTGAEQEIMSRAIPEDGLKIFYNADLKSAEAGWMETWTKNALPQGVRIELSMSAGDSGQGKMMLSRDVLIPTGATDAQ